MMMLFQMLLRFGISRLRELLPFSIAGLIATGVNYGALYLLAGVIAALGAATVAFVLSTGTNFFLQKFWTYREPRLEALPRQLIFFFAASLLGLFINDAIFYGLADVARIGYLFAEIPATAAVSVVGLLASNYIFVRSRAPVRVSR